MANCGRCNHREVCRCFPNPEEYCSYFEPERQHGEWKEVYLTPEEKCFYGELWECSVCRVKDKKSNFCPNCGADMRVKNELNSEIVKSKSEIVPDYRDGWRVKEGDEE